MFTSPKAGVIGSIWQMPISPPSLLKEVHPPAVFDGREREDFPL